MRDDTRCWLNDSWCQILWLRLENAIISFRLNNANFVFFLSTLRHSHAWLSCLFIKMMFIKLSWLLALIITVYHFATADNIAVIYFFNFYFLKIFFIIFIIFIYIPLILLMFLLLNLLSIGICLQIIKICLFNKILESIFTLSQLHLHLWLPNRILYLIIWFSYTIDIRIHLIQVL